MATTLTIAEEHFIDNNDVFRINNILNEFFKLKDLERYISAKGLTTYSSIDWNHFFETNETSKNQIDIWADLFYSFNAKMDIDKLKSFT